MKHLEGKMKFLTIKLSALQSELEASKEILNSASREVDRMYEEEHPGSRNLESVDSETQQRKEIETPEAKPSSTEQNQHENPEDHTPIIKKQERDPEVKKLLRQISLKTHPDKLIEKDETERAKKKALYLQAMKAADENDLLTLTSIAMQLDLEVGEITSEMIKHAENKISSVKGEIDDVKSTIVWHWFFAEEKEKKDEILKILFKKMYEQRKKNNSRT